MKRKNYKAALIGCGRVGSILENDKLREHPCTHAGAMMQCESVELTCGCDTNEERLNTFGKDWEIKRLYTNYKELLEKEKPDIVCIATWSHTHHNIVLDAVHHGIMGILCEKPIALSLKDARKMIRTCKKAGTTLLINHERRWDATYIKVRDMVQQGKIGELRTIVGNVLTGRPDMKSWKVNYSEVGGGPLLHDGTHLFDMMRFIAGDVKWVIGNVSRKNKNIGVEDRGTGFVMFKNGTHAFVEGGGMRNYFNFELDIQGSDGRILVGNGLLQLWHSASSSRYTGFRDLVPKDFPQIGERKSPFLGGIESLINVMEGKEKNFSSGEDGMKALEIIMAIYESARLGGEKTILPLKIKYNPLERMILENII